MLEEKHAVDVSRGVPNRIEEIFIQSLFMEMREMHYSLSLVRQDSFTLETV